MLTTSPNRPVGTRRILLLDLVHTFATRPKVRQWRDYSKVIAETETYRLPLLRRIQADGFYVVMLTARSVRYREVTLANIARHTEDWRPDLAIFNEDEVDPPTCKSRALHGYIFPEFGPQRSRYFAIESNTATRRMYSSEGIKATTWEAYLAANNQRTFDNF